MTPQLIAAIAAVALTLMITVSSILTSSASIPIPITDLKVAAKKADLAIIASDIPIKPLVADLGGQPQANPFTLRASGPPPSRLPPPPPPPLDVPVPPILPLPEK